MVVIRLEISARENIPSSVYIALRSVARVARSTNRRTPANMRNAASERASIPNKSPSVVLRNPAERFAVKPTLSVFPFCPRLAEDLFWSMASGFFTSGGDDNHPKAENKERSEPGDLRATCNSRVPEHAIDHLHGQSVT